MNSSYIKTIFPLPFVLLSTLYMNVYDTIEVFAISLFVLARWQQLGKIRRPSYIRFNQMSKNSYEKLNGSKIE